MATIASFWVMVTLSLVLLAHDSTKVESQVTGKDPCFLALRESSWQRSIAFKASVSQPKHSDHRLVKGWYRFTSKAGKEMPTTCPGPYSCGTHGSVWLKGTPPTKANVVTNLTACVAWDNTCCRTNYQWPVPVMKCQDGTYVYYLTPTPGAAMGYCAGTEVPCPAGSTSPTQFTPGCKDSYPRVKGVPVLTFGVDSKQLQIKCTFESPNTQPEARFDVYFHTGSPSYDFKKITLKGTERIATVKNEYFTTGSLFKLGQMFSCRVSGHFDYSANLRGPEVESKLFFAGIKVEPKQVQFRLTEKDKPLKLKVTSTVPIVCKNLVDCKVLVNVGQLNTQTVFDYCTLEFKTSPKAQTKTLEVVAKRDFIDDGDHTMNVAFKVLKHLDPKDWDNHVKIPDAQIMAVDIATATCTSTGDPHIKTFDKLYYNHFSVGDYVLVKSKSRKFEVHVRTWKCASVSCNCGIAVREGDDVAIVDMCRGGIPRVTFPSEDQPKPGFKVVRSNNGRSFLINLPSGAFVKFDAYRWFAHWNYANFVVQVPSDDFRATEGLCGTFDRNPRNEMKAKNGVVHTRLLGRRIAPHAFTESWRLPTGGSMFYQSFHQKKKCNADRIKYFCTCLDNNKGYRRVNCDFEGWGKRPKYTQNGKNWKGLTFPGAEHCGRRRRRSTDDDIILPDDGNVLGNYTADRDANLNFTVPSFPTGSGKTESGTKSYCKRMLETSDVGMVCLKLPGVELLPYLEQCVEDILFSDNNTFVFSSIGTLREDCEELVLRNVSLWKPDQASNGTLAPPPDVGNTLCLNLCSGNGKCQNGTCICNAGYVSSDCSLHVNQGPTVTEIPNGGLCDIRKRECIRTRVTGDDFFDNNKLTCRTQAVKISDKAFVVTKNIKKSRAFLLSFREVSCEFPATPLLLNGNEASIKGVPAAGYLIDISNDATTFSRNNALFLVYDSKCLECVGGKIGTCKHKVGSCNVNGYCFAKGEADPVNWCRVCDPSESETKFTERKVHRAPVFTMSSLVTAYADQELRLQLSAYDPDNLTVTFELGDRKEGCSLTPGGLLVTTPRGDSKFYVDVRAFDGCKMKTNFVLEITPKHCPCKNGGKCVTDAKTAKLSCQCMAGCTGLECESEIDGETCKDPQAGSSKDKQNKTMLIVILASALGLLALVVVIVLVIRLKKQRANSELKVKAFESSTPQSKRGMENKAYSMNQLQDD